MASEAVESTRTLVLKYAGRVVNAPYHSTCGGSTAAASEIWRSSDEPYLQRVSDRIPGHGSLLLRHRAALSLDAHARRPDGERRARAVSRQLHVACPDRTPGVAQSVTVGSHTRVGARRDGHDHDGAAATSWCAGTTFASCCALPVARSSTAPIFPSRRRSAPTASLARLTLHGMGYGHGVGMCQWGAIGRARAGQDFRTILRTYYPGTTVGPRRTSARADARRGRRCCGDAFVAASTLGVRAAARARAIIRAAQSRQAADHVARRRRSGAFIPSQVEPTNIYAHRGRLRRDRTQLARRVRRELLGVALSRRRRAGVRRLAAEEPLDPHGAHIVVADLAVRRDVQRRGALHSARTPASSSRSSAWASPRTSSTRRER